MVKHQLSLLVLNFSKLRSLTPGRHRDAGCRRCASRVISRRSPAGALPGKTNTNENSLRRRVRLEHREMGLDGVRSPRRVD